MLPVRRARFLAEFTLSSQSEILRFAQDDSEGLRMTGLAVSEILQGFSACKTWISGGTIVKDTFGSDGSQEKGQL